MKLKVFDMVNCHSSNRPAFKRPEVSINRQGRLYFNKFAATNLGLEEIDFIKFAFDEKQGAWYVSRYRDHASFSIKRMKGGASRFNNLPLVMNIFQTLYDSQEMASLPLNKSIIFQIDENSYTDKNGTTWWPMITNIEKP